MKILEKIKILQKIKILETNKILQKIINNFSQK